MAYANLMDVQPIANPGDPIVDGTSGGRSCPARQNPCFLNPVPFKEVNSIKEFSKAICKENPSCVCLDRWVFHEVDFSSIPLDEWEQYSLRGALFLGCTFPSSEHSVRQRGGQVWEQFRDIPFKAFRRNLYSQKELLSRGDAIYHHFLEKKDFTTLLAQSLHDFSMNDALGQYLVGKFPVGVMGGHRLRRNSVEYRDLVLLCRSLARAGFLIVTGGGPGAMEAANLGGYLVDKTDEEVNEAIRLISANVGYEDTVEVEYNNTQPAQNVIDRFGVPTSDIPSLGVPTFRYGHEPSNRFAAFHGKFFSNAIREDGLLQLSTAGIIFTRGGAGTRQEIFQAACHNTYAITPEATRPMIFVGQDYWQISGLYDMLAKFAEGEEFHKYLLMSDNNEEILQKLVEHAKIKGLALNSSDRLTQRS